MKPLSLTVVFLFFYFHPENRFEAEALVGPYNMIVEEINNCPSGSSKADYVKSNFSIIKLPNEEQEFRGFTNITKDAKVTKGLLHATVIGDLKVPDFRQEITRPCKGIIFAEILKVHLLATKDCTVKKGFYKVHTRPNKMIHSYFHNIVYAKYKLKMGFYCKNAELMCLEWIINIVPAAN